jgi:AcrR family transcriptional regulator
MKDVAAASDRIVSAAGEIAAAAGFASLTVGKVADRAQVSTALVHYHFDTKQALLTATAHRLAAERAARRAAALAGRRALSALDALWEELSGDAATGIERAWLELQALARDDESIRGAVQAARTIERDGFSRRMPKLLEELGSEAPAGAEEAGRALAAVTDGLGVALTAGETPDAVRAAYDAFWLMLIAAGQGGGRRR